MAKIDNRLKENMQLTIEFADNGIILRNPECEDEMTLVLTGKGTHKAEALCKTSTNYCFDFSEGNIQT